MILDAILASFFISFVLLVWFQTNVFVEYFFFLPIVKQYKKAQNAGVVSSFVNFLSINYNCFFVRLVTCTYCLNFWLVLPFVYFIDLKFFGLIYILSIVYFKIILLLSKYESR
jgi:hypothetical protein